MPRYVNKKSVSSYLHIHSWRAPADGGNFWVVWRVGANEDANTAWPQDLLQDHQTKYGERRGEMLLLQRVPRRPGMVLGYIAKPVVGHRPGN